MLKYALSYAFLFLFSFAKTLKLLVPLYENADTGNVFKCVSYSYRATRPSVHTMPSCFHAKSQNFTEKLGKCGMYRNHSLNTAVDKNKASSHHDGLF